MCWIFWLSFYLPVSILVPSKLICLPLEFSFCLHISKRCYCNKFYFLFFSQVAASRQPVPVWAFLGRTSAGLPFQFVTHLTILIFLLSCQSCAWFLHCVSPRWIWSLSLRGCAPGGCAPGTSLVFIFATQGTGGVVRSCCSLDFLRSAPSAGLCVNFSAPWARLPCARTDKNRSSACYWSHHSPLLKFWFLCEFLCGSLQGDVGIVLKSPDQKTRGFVVQIVLPRWFPERVHQLFGEMPMRIYIVLWSDFYRQSHTCSCLHRFVFPLRFLTRF
jgi:hypothetical protein